MGDPRTSREALIAQMLEELDGLLGRAEQLPESIAQAEARVAVSVRILNEAGDRYRLAVTAFTEEAKTVLAEYVQHKAKEAADSTVERHRTALQEAALAALRCRDSQHATEPGKGAEQREEEFRSRVRIRLFEHGITALVTSLLTATLVLLIVRLT